MPLQSFYKLARFIVLFWVFTLCSLATPDAQANPAWYVTVSVGSPYAYSGYAPYYGYRYGYYGYYGYYRPLRIPADVKRIVPSDTPSLQTIALLGEMKKQIWLYGVPEIQAEPTLQPRPNRPELYPLPPEITVPEKNELSPSAQEALDPADHSI